MKKYFKIFSIAAISAATLLSSCVKEDGVFTDGGSNGIVEFSELPSRSSATSYSFLTVSFDAATESTWEVKLNYTGENGAPANTTVELMVNDAAVTAYNTAQSTAYVILPSTLYTIPSSTVTIPQGAKEAKFVVKLKTSAFDFSKAYAMGLTIKSTSNGVVSSNYGTGVFRVVSKNAYEASYTTTGWLFHPTAGRALNATYAMTTAGASTVQAPVGDLGTSNYYFQFNVTGSVLSNFVPIGANPTGTQSGFFTADRPGASASWVNSAGTAQPGVAPYVHSTYNNTYDAANKTFWMHYGYAPGATGEAEWTRQVYGKYVRK